MRDDDDRTRLPDDLPAPIDDGACDHLADRALEPLALASTDGAPVDLAMQPGRSVVFCFPRAGQPGIASPAGWDEIPGARGCTPEALAFGRHQDDIRALHAEIFGLSTQTPEALAEIKTRLALPFALLSDAELGFAKSLGLPTFEVEGLTMIRRLTLVITEGMVEKVFYPVFPPDQAAEEVIVWLLQHPRRPED
jgi:peroxiredoxin